MFHIFFFGPRRAFRFAGCEAFKVGRRIQWGIVGASIAVLCSLGVAQEASLQGTMALDEIVQSMEKAQAAGHGQVSYQIIREYRLFGAQDSKANSEVVAEVN